MLNADDLNHGEFAVRSDTVISINNSVLIPTMNLRWAIKLVPLDGMTCVSRRVTVLQQQFKTTDGQTVWKDVPTEDLN